MLLLKLSGLLILQRIDRFKKPSQSHKVNFKERRRLLRRERVPKRTFFAHWSSGFFYFLKFFVRQRLARDLLQKVESRDCVGQSQRAHAVISKPSTVEERVFQ